MYSLAQPLEDKEQPVTIVNEPLHCHKTCIYKHIHVKYVSILVKPASDPFNPMLFLQYYVVKILISSIQWAEKSYCSSQYVKQEQIHIKLDNLQLSRAVSPG